jgi:hypothetical protein
MTFTSIEIILGRESREKKSSSPPHYYSCSSLYRRRIINQSINLQLTVCRDLLWFVTTTIYCCRLRRRILRFELM